ncbi:MAG: type II secretion system protein N [Steroidobacteraceae bacterium]
MAQRPRRDVTARPEPSSSRRTTGWLVAVGLVALGFFVITTLPASLLAGHLQPYQLGASGYSGTIWSGTANGFAWRGATLGDLQWRLRPWALLRGRIAADVTMSLPGGSASAALSAGPSGQIALDDVNLDLPLEALSALPVASVHGWQGRAVGHFDTLSVAAGSLQDARGTLDLTGLVSPAPNHTPYGSYRFVIPDPAVVTTGVAPGVTAHMSDLGGSLAVDGRVTFSAGRSYLLEGTVAPRGNAPESLQRALQFLGPADAAGRRPFSVSGTL